VLPQACGERLAGVLGTGDQHSRADQGAAALADQRPRKRFSDELVGNESGDDAAHGERLGGHGPDRRDLGRREDARRQSPRHEAIEHDLHGVLAGEHDPTVGG